MKHRLLLLVIAALIPPILLALGVAIYSLRQQQASIRAEATHSVRDILDAVEQEVLRQIEVLQAIGSSQWLDSPTPDLGSFHAQITRFTNKLKHWEVLILADLEGRQIVNTRVPFGTPLPRVLDVETYRRVIETKQPMVSGISGAGPFSPDRPPRLIMRVPIIQEGEVRYVLSAILQPQGLSELADRGLPPGWHSFLVDKTGRIAASAQHPERIGQSPSAQTLAARGGASEGFYEGLTSSGEQTVTVFRSSGTLGWSAHISISKPIYNAPLARSLWIFGAALAAALIATLIVVGFLRREALRRERTIRLLGVTLENMDQGLIMVDGDGILQVCNQRAVEMLDLPAHYTHSKPSFSEFIAHQVVIGEFAGLAEERVPWLKLKDNLLSAPPGYERTRPNGMHLEVRTVHLPDGTAVRTFTDITDHKRAEAELKESEGRYRLLAENTTDVITRVDMTLHRLYVSPASYDILGYGPEELLGGTPEELLHPDDAAALYEKFSALRTGHIDRASSLHRFRHKDGHWVWVEVGFRLTRSEKGEPKEIISVIRDVTERLQLEEQLRQAQKMEAVGQLTGGIAHDFNNLLTVILGNAEILTEDPSDPALTFNLARQILETAQRGADLNQKLLTFGRRQSMKPERLKIERVVGNMVPLLYRAVGEHIEIETNFPETRLATIADRSLLESALLNLAVNARDAMPQGGTLTITAGERIAGPGEGSLPIGQDVIFVTVSDTGTGMAPDVLERVFEPFFTTKEIGKGSGLGLSMVFGFAQQSAGHVSIVSKPGEGTAVTIVLPAVTGVSAQPEGREARTILPAAGKVRILVAEDEPQVLQFVSTQLISLGYDVTAVATGHDALELLEQDQDFALLFSDVVLPKGMNGVELSKRARVIRPRLKVLLTSGYSEEAFEDHGRPEEGTLLLRKPYRRKELAETLRKVLEA